jgi:hypothetical protein
MLEGTWKWRNRPGRPRSGEYEGAGWLPLSVGCRNHWNRPPQKRRDVFEVSSGCFLVSRPKRGMVHVRFGKGNHLPRLLLAGARGGGRCTGLLIHLIHQLPPDPAVIYGQPGQVQGAVQGPPSAQSRAPGLQGHPGTEARAPPLKVSGTGNALHHSTTPPLRHSTSGPRQALELRLAGGATSLLTAPRATAR